MPIVWHEHRAARALPTAGWSTLVQDIKKSAGSNDSDALEDTERESLAVTNDEEARASTHGRGKDQVVFVMDRHSLWDVSKGSELRLCTKGTEPAIGRISGHSRSKVVLAQGAL